jgi:hypothetical protein
MVLEFQSHRTSCHVSPFLTGWYIPIITFGGMGTNFAEMQAEMKRKEKNKNAVFQRLRISFTVIFFFITLKK